jgi:hypothetical protein
MENDNDALSKLVKNVTVSSSLQMPEFNTPDPEMWFAVVEAYFLNARVMDVQQRYLNAVSSLPPRYVGDVKTGIRAKSQNEDDKSLTSDLSESVCTTPT